MLQHIFPVVLLRLQPSSARLTSTTATMCFPCWPYVEYDLEETVPRYYRKPRKHHRHSRRNYYSVSQRILSVFESGRGRGDVTRQPGLNSELRAHLLCLSYCLSFCQLLWHLLRSLTSSSLPLISHTSNYDRREATRQ